MKKKEPEFKCWQRLVFKFFGVRRLDILKLALARLKYKNEVGGNYFLCPLVFDIMVDLGMIDRAMANRMPAGYLVHEFIPKFEHPSGFGYWDVSWWMPSCYVARKEFLLELIEYYKNDKKRFQINIYNHGKSLSYSRMLRLRSIQ